MSDLLEAIFKYDLGTLKSFINGGENINCRVPGTEGCTILHIVAGLKRHAHKDELLSYLLNSGADPNALSKENLTPVHIAAMWDNFVVLEKLLQNKGNPWLVDNKNKNAFDMAADHHSYEAYQILNKYLSENRLNFRTTKNTNKSNLKFQIQNNNSKITYHSSNVLLVSSTSDDDDGSRSYLLDVSKIIRRNKLLENKVERNDDKSSEFEGNLFQNLSKKKENHIMPDLDNAMFLSSEENSTDTNWSSGCSNITVIEKDILSGIILVEEDSLSQPGHLTNDSSSFVINDWRSCKLDFSLDSSNLNQELSNSKSRLGNCSVGDQLCDWISCRSDFSYISVNSESIPNTYKKLSNSEIFQELLKCGDKPGPVNDHTRNVYLKRLLRIKSGCYVPVSLCEPKYCLELQHFLEGKLNMCKIQLVANNISEEFNDSKTTREWREGNKKCCFNYFLLDPRVTQNLPARHAELSFEETFQNFIDAIFYVGKGTKGRSYSHLLDAVKALSNSHSTSDKINHILDIWKADYGVISLHCFNNCIPVEAYTQEACIIEALGLKNLTNIKSGDFYGQSAKWGRALKRQVGILFLNKALQIYLNEGEKQIKAKHLKRK